MILFKRILAGFAGLRRLTGCPYPLNSVRLLRMAASASRAKRQGVPRLGGGRAGVCGACGVRCVVLHGMQLLFSACPLRVQACIMCAYTRARRTRRGTRTRGR